MLAQKPKRVRASVLSLALVLLFFMGPTANAAEVAPEKVFTENSVISVTDQSIIVESVPKDLRSDAINTTLEITFDEKDADNTQDLADVIIGSIEQDEAETPASSPKHKVALGPIASPASIYSPIELRCSVGNYKYADNNGNFNIRNNCAYGTVNWGFTIKPWLQSIATSNVSESGMSWVKDLKNQSRNAPHNVKANYFFHGTFKPTRNGNVIGYSDTMKFKVVSGGKPAQATLTISGWNVRLNP